VLALDVGQIHHIANAIDGGQRLQHAVPPALPPILQSHRRKLVALQDRQWSTLQGEKEKTVQSTEIKEF
jgi:hypothetical protein